MNFYDVLAAKNWDGGIPTINFFDLLFSQSISGEQWQVYDGTLPATINANGSDLRQYQVWGNTGGVGDKTVNLFDYTNITSIPNKYLTSDGNIVNSSGWSFTDYIPVDGNVFTVGKMGGNEPSICLYDENKQFISGASYLSGGVSTKKYTTVTGQYAKFARFSYYSANLPAKDNLTKIMLTEGSTAPASFVPFGYEVDMRVGSWSPYATHPGTLIDMTTGGENSSPQYSTAYFNNFFPSTAIITVKADTAGGGRTLRYMPYDKNQAPMLDYKAEVQFVRDGREVQQAVTIPSSAAYYGVSYHNGDTQKKISTTTPIYIGDDPLEKDEYIDYQAGKIYRMINGTLTPTDPPAPLPALPTCDGVTIVEYAGQSVAPEKVLFEYKKGI